MKRIMLFFMAAIFSGSAVAEWTQLGDSTTKKGVANTRGVKIFVHNEGIIKIGDRSIMWTLKDYQSAVKVGRKNHSSSKSLEEYDCKNMQYKTLSFYWYSKHKGKGDVVYTESPNSNMQPIIPNSFVHDAWKIACGK